MNDMHSLAPFMLGGVTPDRDIRIVDANGQLVARVANRGDTPSDKTLHAHNATLLRISPELAELLAQAIDRGVDAPLATRAAKLLEGLKD